MRAVDVARESASASMHALLLAHTHATLALTAQGALYAGRHAVNERCARWLLTIHDCVARTASPDA